MGHMVIIMAMVTMTNMECITAHNPLCCDQVDRETTSTNILMLDTEQDRYKAFLKDILKIFCGVMNNVLLNLVLLN